MNPYATERPCSQCGQIMPGKKPRPSNSTGKRRSLPKARAARCQDCLALNRSAECVICGVTFSPARKEKTCGNSCGAKLSSKTRRERGDFKGFRIHKPEKPVVVMEWRGSAIDKVRALRGECFV